MLRLIDLLENKADSLGVSPETVRSLRMLLERGIDAAEHVAAAERNASDRLLSHVSHELRTPLTPALLAICLLQRDRTLPAGVQDELATIRRNLEQEARLIDNLIDHATFSQAASAHAPPQRCIA